MINYPLVTFVFGTRPEAIKLAPVILAFQKCDLIKTRVVSTGQHKEIVDESLAIFGVKIDLNLNLMKEKQTLNDITCGVLRGLEVDFKENKPNLIIVQGDTTSAFASGLIAFYQGIKIAHVEAGLRTNNLLEPFPEEANRRLISQISNLNFCPTVNSKNNLINSGVPENICIITGNTVIDALLMVAKDVKLPTIEGLDWINKEIIFATVHRRENWGDRLIEITRGIRLIVEKYPNINILIPMHPNPIVRDTLKTELASYKQIILTEPFDYKSMIGALKGCKLVLTDSGGIQEEAPSLGKPVLVLRNTTEREEAIVGGTAKLVGYKSNNILKNVEILLEDRNEYEKMSLAENPFGDGNASKKILEKCLQEII
tara:strand:+ start:2572 stop:3684 length:1113 start_codon:yes stop_codon:yes gene_type:complete